MRSNFWNMAKNNWTDELTIIWLLFPDGPYSHPPFLRSCLSTIMFYLTLWVMEFLQSVNCTFFQERMKLFMSCFCSHVLLAWYSRCSFSFVTSHFSVLFVWWHHWQLPFVSLLTERYIFDTHLSQVYMIMDDSLEKNPVWDIKAHEPLDNLTITETY